MRNAPLLQGIYHQIRHTCHLRQPIQPRAAAAMASDSIEAGTTLAPSSNTDKASITAPPASRATGNWRAGLDAGHHLFQEINRKEFLIFLLIHSGTGGLGFTKLLQNITAQVFVARQFVQEIIDVFGIQDHRLAGTVRRLEGNHVQQPFHDGVQASRNFGMCR